MPVRRPRLAVTVAAVLATGVASAATATAGGAPGDPAAPGGVVVGRLPDGGALLPTGQLIHPVGSGLELPGRPNAVAVRPGAAQAAVLVASSGTALRTVDLTAGRWLDSSTALGDEASYAGLAWSPDGRTLAASGAHGSVALLRVDAAGHLGPARRVTIPTATTGPNLGQNPYPGGLAFSADGGTLYVALSRDNALGVVDTATATLRTRIPVGNAPHTVLVHDGVAYVSNEGGRPAAPTDPTNDSAGTRIVTDGTHGGAATGSVSEVDLATGTAVRTAAVGLHPTALAWADGALVVVNTASDTLSLVDPGTATVTATVALPTYRGAPLGSGPTGVAVLPDRRLAVSLGLSNAVALVDLHGRRGAARDDGDAADGGAADGGAAAGRVRLGTRPAGGVARETDAGTDAAAGPGDAAVPVVAGLLPAAWYPADVAYDPRSARLVVANLHGVGTTADADAGRSARGLGEVGTVGVVALPDSAALRRDTAQVATDNHWPTGDAPAPGGGGLPSGIRHVLYIVKENRTYDQVLGDVGRGNSDPALAEFGRHVTPNTHALATQFPLLDNFYNSGRRSNDGHQWAMQAAAPDYLEKGVSTQRTDVVGLGRGTPPSSGFDALLYLHSGFIWEDALAHGRTFADFGEYTVEGMPPPAVSDVPTLEPYVAPEYSGFELTTPDVYRARLFRTHLAAYAAAGSMPSLITLTLPNDHTGGSNPLYPTPATQVADNDQALGQIVDAVSHSAFWPSTAIFVEEDDTQGGVDHVEGHRGPLLVVSPYARHGGYVDSHLYTQDSVLRTIELLLGLPPLTQLDAAAAPLTAAFDRIPDLTPYQALVPDVLAGGPVPNPPLSALRGVRRAWAVSAQQQDTRHPDAADPVLLNHDIWYATHAWAVPYPGEPAVFTPAQVLAREGRP